MIPGGDGSAEGFASVAAHLAERYTVVTYDRRGCFRSTLDAPVDELRLETHGEDASLLLAALTNEPAYVFGSSAGALVALDLAIRSPQRVRVLVAHEPPVFGLRPDLDDTQEDLHEVYRRQGGLELMRRLVAINGITYDDLEAGVEFPKRTAAPNGDALFAYTFLPVSRYRLDVAALKAAPTRVVIAGASGGREYACYQYATALAARTGTSVVEFPSHHAGYVSHPRAFARRLHEVLAANLVS
jgi:pimeloyl-ACP methyl ester carboxylesterase